MIKVLRHGHAPYAIKCDNCECIFSFESDDIQFNGNQRDWAEWVTCPECMKDVIIDSRSKYRVPEILKVYGLTLK